MTDKLITPDIYIALALVQSVVFLLLIRFLDLYEREPLSMVSVMFVWGAIGAAILASVGNQIVLGLLTPQVRAVFGAAISGALVEEIAKGLALVAAFIVSQWTYKRFGWLGFEGVTDGVVYGAAIGLGFAFTEDLFYLFEKGGLQTYLLRVDFLGMGSLGHAVYTGTFGAGLGLATWSRSRWRRIGFAALGLGLAMLMHALHNGLVQLILVLRYGMEPTAAWLSNMVFVPASLLQQMRATADAANVVGTLVDYAFVVAFFSAIAIWLWHQRCIIGYELKEEANQGLISQQEEALMSRYWRRSLSYWRLLQEGKLDQWRQVRREHNELVDLALLKWRIRKVGGDWREVEKERRRIANLRSERAVE
jgi:protease PrsW